MKRKILSLIVAVMLIVSLFTFIACSEATKTTVRVHTNDEAQEELPQEPADNANAGTTTEPDKIPQDNSGSNDNASTGNQDTNISIGNGGNSKPGNGYVSTAATIDASTVQSFEIVAKRSTIVQQVALGISVTRYNSSIKANVVVKQLDQEGFRFQVIAPNNGYDLGEWYTIKLVDSNLSFKSYTERTINFHITKNLSVGKLNSNVYSIDSCYISNVQLDEEEKAATGNELYSFDFAYAHADIKLNKNDVILIAAEDGSKTAFKIRYAFENPSRPGIQECYGELPTASEIYTELLINEKQNLNATQIDNYTNLVTEESLTQLEEIAAAAFGFNVGDARFDINADLRDNDLYLKIDMTIPDIIKTEDGSFLDLVLTFEVVSTITVDTNISLGSAIEAAKNGISVNASFVNVMSFTATIKEDVKITKTEGLDSIINSIRNMLEDTNSHDVSVPVFNWIIPIGNGVASLSFDANLVMDFSFSGKLGLTSSSTLTFDSTVVYNPEAKDKVSINVTDPKFTFDSVGIFATADIQTKIGLNANIKFDLLAGILGLGIYADVGNYNDLTGVVKVDNFLDPDYQVGYGYYFEGGVYYDVGVDFTLIRKISKRISFFDGVQYVPLYNAGRDYMLEAAFASKNFVLGTEPVEIKITGKIRKLNDRADDIEYIPASEFTVEENPYVEIVDGKLVAKTTDFKNKSIRLSAYGMTTTCTVSYIDCVNVSFADAAVDGYQYTGIASGLSNSAVTAQDADGNAVVISYNKAGAIFIGKDQIAKGKTIIVSISGEETLMIYFN